MNRVTSPAGREYDLDDLWTVWLDGWRRGLRSARLNELRRPSECERCGGPAVDGHPCVR